MEFHGAQSNVKRGIIVPDTKFGYSFPMPFSRRDYLRTMVGTIAAGAAIPKTSLAAGKLGIPGPYPGRVVGVTHSKCVRGDNYQDKPIRDMVDRGMRELTGAATPAEAWRQLFEPTDVVGIKISPVGHPYVCSSRELLHAVIDALVEVGIKIENVTIYERYREILEYSPFPKWAPPGTRLAYAAQAYDPVQMDLAGYDPSSFIELPFTLPGYDVNDKRACRSHAAMFLSQDVNKIINLPVLKSHNAAGVTLALKNLSHGLFNNVSRSHDGPQLRYTEFVPAAVGSPLVRQKVVLNILDATRGVFHGGPGITGFVAENYIWEPKTIYFATDPVAVDIIGRNVIEEQRKKKHLKPLAEAKADQVWSAPVRQPQYIESAGKAGLGEWDMAKIDFRSVKAG